MSDFLDQRKAADPAHFPDLSLSVVKLLGPGEYIVETPGAEHEGHFGLAVHDYTHSTAPNRRYADLVTQRLLKATAARRRRALFGSGIERHRRALHRARRCRAQKWSGSCARWPPPAC